MSQKNLRTSLSVSQGSQVSHSFPSSQGLSSSKSFKNFSLSGVDQGSTDSVKTLLKEIQDQTRTAAHEFADRIVNHSLYHWQLMFSLARRLQSIDGALGLELPAFRKPLDIFLDELATRGVDIINKHDFERHWISFIEAWSAVRTPEGGGKLDRAYKQALVDPVELPVVDQLQLGVKARILISLVFHLSKNGELFFLPQDKIAEFLHVDQRDVSKMIAVLKGHAVLTLVNEARYTEHRAAEYRLGGAWAANKLKVKSIEEQRAKLNAQKKILGL